MNGWKNLLINGVYWGYNPLIRSLILTSWDIQLVWYIDDPRGLQCWCHAPSNSLERKTWLLSLWTAFFSCEKGGFPSQRGVHLCFLVWPVGLQLVEISQGTRKMLNSLRCWKDCEGKDLLPSLSGAQAHPLLMKIMWSVSGIWQIKGNQMVSEIRQNDIPKSRFNFQLC